MPPKWPIACAAVIALTAPVQAMPPAPPAPDEAVQGSLAVFTPRPDGRDHRLDYSVWTEALRFYVVSMGRPLRKMPIGDANATGTRMKIGPTSMYRTDGSMIGYALIHPEVMANIARYRRELEAVADKLDIPALPRNEQLAFWLNLHNVAMVEKIGESWPVRQPRDIELDGGPLEDARFITVRGVALSLRDIRERIVYAHWKNPKVIYGFWHGEIGGPALQREAFDGGAISAQLDRAAQEFTNSRRGVERRGDTLHVSRLYAEVAPFFFPDFQPDLRAHLQTYVEGKVAGMLEQTTFTKASLYEHDIADLSGGRRSNPFFASGRFDAGIVMILAARTKKFEYMRRKRVPYYTVTFSNISLPGDPQYTSEVE